MLVFVSAKQEKIGKGENWEEDWSSSNKQAASVRLIQN